MANQHQRNRKPAVRRAGGTISTPIAAPGASPASRQPKVKGPKAKGQSKRRSTVPLHPPRPPRPPRSSRSTRISPKQPETNTHAALKREVGNNMMEAMGGREAVLSVLEDSAHPKAQQLVDRLRSSINIGENFTTSYTSVGLRAVDVLEIFSNVTQARVLVNALMEGDEVMRSLIRAAKDQIEPHDKCRMTGRVIDRKTGIDTGEDCIQCRGSGFLLKSGSRDAQELYFEIVNWRKSGGLIQIDARKQQANYFAGNGQTSTAGSISGTLNGEAPSVVSIIKRADQVLLGPSVSTNLPLTNNTNDSVSGGMPEDVLIAEPI